MGKLLTEERYGLRIQVIFRFFNLGLPNAARMSTARHSSIAMKSLSAIVVVALFFWVVAVTVQAAPLTSNMTVIDTLTEGMVDIARSVQGGSCEYVSNRESGCAGSIAGVHAESMVLASGWSASSIWNDGVDRDGNFFYTDTTGRYPLLPGHLDSGWIKITFAETFSIEYFGLASRYQLGGTFWNSIRLDAESSTTTIENLPHVPYQLFDYSVNTSWVKITPISSAFRNSGANAIEFWTSQVPLLGPPCRWNPSLLQSSTSCENDWNSYKRADSGGLAYFETSATSILDDVTLSATNEGNMVLGRGSFGGLLGCVSLLPCLRMIKSIF